MHQRTLSESVLILLTITLFTTTTLTTLTMPTMMEPISGTSLSAQDQI